MILGYRMSRTPRMILTHYVAAFHNYNALCDASVVKYGGCISGGLLCLVDEWLYIPKVFSNSLSIIQRQFLALPFPFNRT